MKYFWIASGLRGAYMPDDAFVVEVATRRELRLFLVAEANGYREGGFIGATERAAATLAALAWRDAQKTAPATYPFVLPLARERGSGYAFGIFCSVATKAEFKEYSDAA